MDLSNVYYNPLPPNYWKRKRRLIWENLLCYLGLTAQRYG